MHGACAVRQRSAFPIALWSEHSTGLSAFYKALPKFTRLPEKTRKSYDSALRLASQHKLKDGRLFGSLSIASIKPATADVLFDKLRVVEEPVPGSNGEPIIGDDGKPVTRMRGRTRTALLAIVCCRTAWNWARRAKPEIIPALNPFAGVDLQYEARPTRPVTHTDLMRFVKAADDSGEPSIGDAAMIAFSWLQRQTDIIGRLSWVQHYRPCRQSQYRSHLSSQDRRTCGDAPLRRRRDSSLAGARGATGSQSTPRVANRDARQIRSQA